MLIFFFQIDYLFFDVPNIFILLMKGKYNVKTYSKENVFGYSDVCFYHQCACRRLDYGIWLSKK